MRKPIIVSRPPCPEYPLGLNERFSTATELIEWLKTTQEYKNEQWIQGTGKR